MKKFIIILLMLLFSQVKVFASETINVVFAIDKNYPLFTMIAIDSILLNNKSKSDYKFYVIENNLTKFNKFQMRNFVEKRKQKIEFINVNVGDIDNNNYFKKSIAHLKHVGSITVMKLNIANIIQNEDKVLYLDADVLVTTDLKRLWNLDLGEYPVGMVSDTTKYLRKLFNIIPEQHKRIKGDKYYNAGVILMNLDKMRQENISNILVEEFKKHPEYTFHDQDVINIVLEDRIKSLPERWNMQVDTHWPLGRVVPKKGLYHFIGKWKPWVFYPKTYTIPNYKEFQLLYMEYWNKSYLKIYIPYYMMRGIGIIYKEYWYLLINLLKDPRTHGF